MSENRGNNAKNIAARLSCEHQRFEGDILPDPLHEQNIRVLHMTRTDWVKPIRLSAIISGK
jgi:hypothetical protein